MQRYTVDVVARKAVWDMLLQYMMPWNSFVKRYGQKCAGTVESYMRSSAVEGSVSDWVVIASPVKYSVIRKAAFEEEKLPEGTIVLGDTYYIPDPWFRVFLNTSYTYDASGPECVCSNILLSPEVTSEMLSQKVLQFHQSKSSGKEKMLWGLSERFSELVIS